jgi:hypothetical protein
VLPESLHLSVRERDGQLIQATGGVHGRLLGRCWSGRS